MSEQKRAFREGADGKLYFTYNKGAAYELKPACRDPFTYKILSCELDELVGKEYYRLESAGAELPARFSVNQVEFMLAQLPCTKTEEGEPLELPLLQEEVREFYAKKRKELSKINLAENAKLKGTEWNKNLQARAKTLEELYYYRSKGNAEKVTEFEKQLEKIEAELKKLLDEKGVDLKVLTKKADCSICGDSGIIDGDICACARDMTAAIKSYCAAKRLAKRS